MGTKQKRIVWARVPAKEVLLSLDADLEVSNRIVADNLRWPTWLRKLGLPHPFLLRNLFLSLLLKITRCLATKQKRIVWARVPAKEVLLSLDADLPTDFSNRSNASSASFESNGKHV